MPVNQSVGEIKHKTPHTSNKGFLRNNHSSPGTASRSIKQKALLLAADCVDGKVFTATLLHRTVYKKGKIGRDSIGRYRAYDGISLVYNKFSCPRSPGDTALLGSRTTAVCPVFLPFAFQISSRLISACFILTSACALASCLSFLPPFPSSTKTQSIASSVVSLSSLVLLLLLVLRSPSSSFPSLLSSFCNHGLWLQSCTAPVEGTSSIAVSMEADVCTRSVVLQ